MFLNGKCIYLFFYLDLLNWWKLFWELKVFGKYFLVVGLIDWYVVEVYKL